MNASDVLFQIVLALAGLVIALIAALLTKPQQKIIAFSIAIVLLVTGIVWTWYEVNKKLAMLQPPVPPRPANVYQRIDFEQDLADWKLLICADDPCKGVDSIWLEANGRLMQGQPGYTGKYSLEVQADIRPDRGQVYSLQYCPNVAALADAISANLYVPDHLIERNSIQAMVLAYPVGVDPPLPWPNSTLDVTKPGWQRLFLDLRDIADSEGRSFSQNPIKCVHVDLLLPKSSTQQVEMEVFRLDDVEFLKPLP